jgi:hypothetical protein
MQIQKARKGEVLLWSADERNNIMDGRGSKKVSLADQLLALRLPGFVV